MHTEDINVDLSEEERAKIREEERAKIRAKIREEERAKLAEELEKIREEERAKIREEERAKFGTNVSGDSEAAAFDFDSEYGSVQNTKESVGMFFSKCMEMAPHPATLFLMMVSLCTEKIASLSGALDYPDACAKAVDIAIKDDLFAYAGISKPSSTASLKDQFSQLIEAVVIIRDGRCFKPGEKVYYRDTQAKALFPATLLAVEQAASAGGPVKLYKIKLDGGGEITVSVSSIQVWLFQNKT